MDIRGTYSSRGYSSRSSSRGTARSSVGSSSSKSSAVREQASRKQTPDVYSETITTTASTAPDVRDKQHPPQRSASSHLSSRKTEYFLQRTMDKRIHDVANSPSSSRSSLLHNLLELKGRGYQNAPGSNLTLSYNGGLPGGGRRIDSEQTVLSSSIANNYRTLTYTDLQTEVRQLTAESTQLVDTINAMPAGPEKQQLTERYETLLSRHNKITEELSRRDRIMDE